MPFTQTNTAPVEQAFWIEPDDFHCMWGPFVDEPTAERAIKDLHAGEGPDYDSYTGALRVVRARTRIYPQDWQGEHSETYLTMREGIEPTAWDEEEG